MLILKFSIKNEKLIHKSSFTKTNIHSNNSLYINQEDSFINFTTTIGLVFLLVIFGVFFLLLFLFLLMNYHFTVSKCNRSTELEFPFLPSSVSSVPSFFSSLDMEGDYKNFLL